MKRVYAANDQFCYARPAPRALGIGSMLLQDPNLKVREDSADLSKLVDELSNLTLIESTDLAQMLQDKWRLASPHTGSART
jgi:hypothetical protein